MSAIFSETPLTLHGYTFRHIRPEDNKAIASIIRQVMTEFNANGPGYSIHDPEVDQMCQAYSQANHAYFIAEKEGHIVGGAGIGPLQGSDGSVCELRKMYFLSEARGLGLGKKILELCLNAAKELGYAKCYLETVNRMAAAQKLYQSMGFRSLDRALGNTGHSGCDAWYEMDL